jgi:hypothetical protein
LLLLSSLHAWSTQKWAAIYSLYKARPEPYSSSTW